MSLVNEEIWAERWRPTKLEDVVISDSLRSKFDNMIKTDNIPNMTLYSSQPGSGKTTIAKLLVKVLDREHLFLNGSKENGIDMLRNKVETFCMTQSFNGKKKVIIIDEADYLTINSAMPALRGMIEQFHNNCSFILTCNYKERIIEPLISRCPIIDFNIKFDERLVIAKNIQKRMFNILEQSNIDYDKRTVTNIIQDAFPDIRSIISKLQEIYNATGRVNEYISETKESLYAPIVDYIKSKNYKMIKEWVRNNSFNTRVYKDLYDVLYKEIAETSKLKISIILIISKYENRSIVGNKEISLLACLTEIMSDW
jgi:DNA polymerase III delta prime subunit